MQFKISTNYLLIIFISCMQYSAGAQSNSLSDKNLPGKNVPAKKSDPVVPSFVPWADAIIDMAFSNSASSLEKQTHLQKKGEGNITRVKLTDTSMYTSHKHGSDGMAASFDGKAWYSLEEKKLPSHSEALTLYMRINAKRPGGLIRTSLFSLAIHESGLLIAIPAIAVSTGRMYREVPLSFIRFNEWFDIVLRFQNGYCDLILNGELINHIAIAGKLHSITNMPVMIGGWQIDDPPVQSFPKPVIEYLFQRLFTGGIDHVAIWNGALTDNEIASICKVSSVTTPVHVSAAQQCLADYNEFTNASRSKDIPACEQLGLSMRRFMAKDKRRPTYHLTAPMDAILDPAGAFYYNGQYHVFSYRNMVSLLACTPLAHFVSDDLVHWKDWPIAVWPDNDVDVYGIWLANLFYNDKGVPSMLYTGLGKKGKFGILAESHDSLVFFANKKAVITGVAHHDGHTWKDGDTWYSITTKQYWGKRPGNRGDGIVLLSSTDLHHWKELGEIFSVQKSEHPVDDNQRQGFAEYPYLLPFGDKYVLMAGTKPVRYWIGKFDKNIPAFVPDDPDGKLLDYLNPFFCFNPQTIDHKGKDGEPRRIIEAMHLYTSGNVQSIPWYGVHVFPRILTRNGERLEQEPVPEISVLRGANFHKENIRITDQATGLLAGLTGDALEIIATFEPGTAKRVGLKLRISKDEKQFVKVFYDIQTGEFGATGNLGVPKPYAELGKGPAYLKKGEAIRVHLLLDHSLLEVFVNGQTGSAIFNGDTSATGIDLFSEGGEAVLTSLDAWEMKAAWPLEN